MMESKGRRNSWHARLLSSREFAPLLSLVLIFALFALIAPRFTMFWNIKILCKQAAINGILAISLFLVVLTGGIDVSIGANLALQCVIVGHLVDWNVPVPLIVVIVIATGAMIGFLMGLLVTKINLPDLIVTLAAQNLIRGVALMFCQKSYNFFPDFIVTLGSGVIADTVPVAFVVFMAMAVLMWIFLTKTRPGRNVYAIGGSRDAARLCGIGDGKVKRTAYTLSGALVSVAALLYCGMYKSVLASKIGSDTINTLLAIVLLGGTSIAGGYGSIGGVLIGTAIMTVINNGMILAKAADYWITAITGLLILGSLVIQYMQGRVNVRKACSTKRIGIAGGGANAEK
ncbi:MAG: ABC transporter permease [Candidatus Limiplasma sp.]|nr:ABC transporter permease [Candidatus Limiplasma sp.]